MKIVAVVQARTGSRRLPRKVLAEIEGKSVIEHIVNALKCSKMINEIVIATTTKSEDSDIVQLADNFGVQWFRGSEKDVLERFIEAAKMSNADVIVRITADDPLHDPGIIDNIIENHISSGADYTSNVLSRTFPRGYDTEVFNYNTLLKADSLAKTHEERAHVTTVIRDNPSIFRLHSVEAPADMQHPEWRLCLDTEDDMKLIKEIYARLYTGQTIKYGDIIRLFKEEPGLPEINSNVEQEPIKGRIY